jgi:ATP-dependent helicase/nuclease subunit A
LQRRGVNTIMPKWTSEQQAAIDARDCNLLVSAAAGSGKTAVLVERILQLIIKDGVDIDSLLVVTFTNAAAGEMRERIGSALMKALDSDSEVDSEHLRRQMNLLSKASISTLHAFCINVIRKYFHVIDLDPGFRIGDETECGLIKLEVIEDLFEREYEKGFDLFLGLVERYGNNRQDEPLQDLVLRLHDFIQSKPYPKQWLETIVQDFAMSVEEIEDSSWCKALLSEISMDISGAIDLLREALSICRRPGGPSVYEANLLDDLAQLEDLLSAAKNRGLRACCDVYKDIKFTNLKRSGKDVDPALKEAVQELRKQVKEILAQLGGGFLSMGLEHSIGQLNELYPYMQYLCDLVLQFDREYKQQKHERGLIDFNDLEHYALDILQDEDVAAELRSKYSHIFIDEYQDSNLVQETILSRICRPDNLFMVGDVKQSIYRFRLADPSIFLSKYSTYLPREGEINRRIDLNKNFRSRPHILDGVNFLFRSIMSTEFGEMEYDDDAALYQGLEMPAIKNPEVELHLVEKAVKEDEELDPDMEDLSDIEVEAMIAAQRIQKLIGTEIYDAKLEAYRKVDYRDIVVLLRSTKGWATVFQEVFAAKGIPVYADINTGYFEALEIKTMVALLKLIDNKNQDIPLLTVMRSPIGGFDAQDLIQIRARSRMRTFYLAASEYADNHDDDLSKRLKAFNHKIVQWQQAARYLPMEDFIWKLYMESGYYYYAGAMPGGAQRQANLRILLDRARQFQQTSIKGLFQFIRFIDRLQSSSGDMGVAKTLGENENVLRIMSIHKSKGLEFPVVIAAGLGKQFNLMDTNASVLFHKDLGLGPKYVNPDTRQSCDTIAKSAMKQVIRLESLSEEMRILYVACTRPKDKLILLGSVREMENAVLKWARRVSPYYLSKGKSYLDWICPVLMRHKDCAALRQLMGSEEFEEPLVNDPSGWQVVLHSRADITAITKEDKLNKKEQLYRLEHPDQYLTFIPKKDHESKCVVEVDEEVDIAEIRDLIDERFSWSYPYKLAVNIPSKLTVTEINKIQGLRASELLDSDDGVIQHYPIQTTTLINRPRFLEASRKFTAAERGTIVHFVLQHLDLTRVDDESSIKHQVIEMVERELITEEEAEVVDTGLITSFYQSETGMRIRRASGVRREVPFNFRKKASEVLKGYESIDDMLLIQGVIDCFFEEDGQWVLVDYKTDYVDEAAAVEKLVERYRVQIDLYTEALEKITSKPVKERILYLLSINKAVLI